jgi:molybdopterin molybdotransferase
MEFLKAITIENAIKTMSHRVSFNVTAETVGILSSVGRICANDIVSVENVPAFDRSTVDGYALHASDTFGSSENTPSLLNIIGEVAMGDGCDISISNGECVYVPTGAMLPQNANAVVMIENTEKLTADTLCVHKAATPKENIVFCGDDVGKNTTLFPKGHRLTPNNIGVLSACGVGTVKVQNPLYFFIISTGDELIDVSSLLKKGQVRDINSYALQAQIEAFGGMVSGVLRCRDDLKALEDAISRALTQADIVLISGGSSKGERDYTVSAILNNGGEILFHGLNIKPGKPTIGAVCNGKPVFGLPGHPVASLIVLRELVFTLCDKLSALVYSPIQVPATIIQNIHSDPGKKTFIMVSLKKGNGITYTATPLLGKSGLITLFSKADGYIVIDDNSEGLESGKKVTVTLL